MRFAVSQIPFFFRKGKERKILKVIGRLEEYKTT